MIRENVLFIMDSNYRPKTFETNKKEALTIIIISLRVIFSHKGNKNNIKIVHVRGWNYNPILTTTSNLFKSLLFVGFVIMHLSFILYPRVYIFSHSLTYMSKIPGIYSTIISKCKHLNLLIKCSNNGKWSISCFLSQC